ncbi:MAG: AtpZ/AtpI family protein [Proteobacteria bacterium]|nr:AtpZ/AtpI family protein [Pseudomonadota bacterium]
MSDDPTLGTLKRRIDEAKKNLKISPSQDDMPRTTIGRLFNVGVELVAGVLAGVGAGLVIDWVFGTSPWGLICLFILGSIAGMMNVYRSLTSTKNKKTPHA